MKHFSNVRVYTAFGRITPADKQTGRERGTWVERDRKLEAAREEWKPRRQAARIGSMQKVIGSVSVALLEALLPGETETGSAGEHPAKG